MVGGQPPWVAFSFWDLIPEAVLAVSLASPSEPHLGSPTLLPAPTVAQPSQARGQRDREGDGTPGSRDSLSPAAGGGRHPAWIPTQADAAQASS